MASWELLVVLCAITMVNILILSPQRAADDLPSTTLYHNLILLEELGRVVAAAASDSD